MNTQAPLRPSPDVAAPPPDLPSPAEVEQLRALAGDLLAALGDGQLADTPQGRRSPRWTAEATMLLAEALVDQVGPSVMGDPILKNRWWEQSRVPAGDPEGGQWTEAGGGTAGGTASPRGYLAVPMADTARLQPASATVRAPSPAGDTMNDFSGEWVREPSWETGDGDGGGDDGEVIPAGWSDKSPEARKALSELLRALKADRKIGVAINVLEIGVEAAMRIPAIVSAFDPPKTRGGLRLDPEYRDFDSHGAMMRHYADERRPGYVAHHLVAQHPANLEKFGVVQPDGRLVAPRLHNTDNVVFISELLHQWITDWYNSKHPDDPAGRRRWQVLAEKDYEEQYEEGLDVLRKLKVLK